MLEFVTNQANFLSFVQDQEPYPLLEVKSMNVAGKAAIHFLWPYATFIAGGAETLGSWTDGLLEKVISKSMC